MSRGELLQAIASARTLAQTHLAKADKSLLTRIPKIVTMLDMMEARVLAAHEMVGPDALDDIPLGLYAVRELDQPDEQDLVAALCDIQHRLKHR